MSDQPAQLDRINWTSCFSFTQVFRTFKIARHPAIVGLALVAILLTGVWGCLLDMIWPSKYQPVAGEVNAFWRQSDIDAWRESRLAGRGDVIAQTYARLGRTLPKELDAPKLREDPGGAIKLALSDLEAAYPELAARAADKKAVALLAKNYAAAHGRISDLRTKGVFRSLITYETRMARHFLESAAALQFSPGVRTVLLARRDAALSNPGLQLADADLAAALAGVRGNALAAGETGDELTGVGALGSLLLMARGAHWLFTEYPWFAIIFSLGKLAIWALFGGAICRMAALNYARDERIPVKTAIGFARRKYLGFLLAPLMPIGIILLIGAILLVGGLICQVPVVGDILGGLGMGLALLGGVAMAIILVGFLAGSSLMWPTVAAEGSDAFDAMSRSYSYVLTRPWKAALYALAASVYGAICYLFVRLMVWLILRGTRIFVGAGLGLWTSRPGTGLPEGTKIDAIWPTPSFDNFWPPLSPFGYQRWFEWLAMGLTKMWVMLVVLALCAFLVSFYYSAATIIYFLLRRDVDHTDLEDVDTEDSAEEEAAPAGGSDGGGGGGGAEAAPAATGETSS